MLYWSYWITLSTKCYARNQLCSNSVGVCDQNQLIWVTTNQFQIPLSPFYLSIFKESNQIHDMDVVAKTMKPSMWVKSNTRRVHSICIFIMTWVKKEEEISHSAVVLPSPAFQMKFVEITITKKICSIRTCHSLTSFPMYGNKKNWRKLNDLHSFVFFCDRTFLVTKFGLWN